VAPSATLVQQLPHHRLLALALHGFGESAADEDEWSNRRRQPRRSDDLVSRVVRGMLDPENIGVFGRFGLRENWAAKRAR
jgi:hypothetical protein